MDFDLPEETQALQHLCRDFATTHITPHAATWTDNAHIPATLFTHLGQLGLMGMLIPRAYGGTDTGLIPYVTAMIELGTADHTTATTWHTHSTIATLPLLHHGTEAQKQQWLIPLATGTHLGTHANHTTARKTGDTWHLDNTDTNPHPGTDLPHTTTLIATTHHDPANPRYATFLIPGHTTEHHLIGQETDDPDPLHGILDQGRVSLAALSLSRATAALNLAITHATQPEQFGRPPTGFRTTATKIADMTTDVDTARRLVYHAAWLADNNRPYSKEAARAQLHTTEVANRTTATSLQLHGGYGYMRESEISHFYADTTHRPTNAHTY